MLLNDDFTQRASLTPDGYQWVASPQAGVERVMLERIGGEKAARATSIVRYAPGAAFPAHVHPRGEEILVLSGVFTDEASDYPEGWYLRNPPGSSHRPSSRSGAILFVKLQQMDAGERQAVRIDTTDPATWLQRDDRRVCPLFGEPSERVVLEQVQAGAPLLRFPVRGAEVLVIRGGLEEGARRYERGSWLRIPDGECPVLQAGPEGATVYLKTGHLRGDRP